MSISEKLTARLKDPSLATDKALIGGAWVAVSDSGKTFPVTNPATGEVIAVLPDMNRAEPARHRCRLRGAEGVGEEDRQGRAAILRRLYDLMVAMPTTSPRS